ncbi:MAG TPA: DUF368 domain-containing protein [Candidatus Eubacterium faecavium]|nr:DUF368 domain-containing protein [Candidatus Eubacterium faecavium]
MNSDNKKEITDNNAGVEKKSGIGEIIMRLIHGAFIGLGAVLPGISGGVLCVVFGVYRPIMELLSHPFKAIKKHAKLLIPVVIGIGVGFLAISKLLGFLLNKYPDPSVCLFVGLIAGMLPSLFREAGQKGRSNGSFISLGICFIVVLALLLGLNAVNVKIEPNFGWYIFCGFCIALSVIAPGMSFSTLLMPLGLYTPLVEGIGNLDFSVLIPAGIGGLITVILLAKAIDTLMNRHYSVAFHGIIGIVIAATIVIIPFKSFASGIKEAVINIVCIAAGVVIALVLDKFNSKVTVPEK